MSEKANKSKTDNKPAGRLLSIDALRGFDMFFIMGGSTLVAALYGLFPNSFFESLAIQMEHVEWNGFHFYDIIFPLFLFIAGISFPFSLAKSRSKGLTEKKIVWNIIRRGLILILLGAIYNGLLSFDFANVRYASVLGRIGIAWMIAALIYRVTNTRTRLIITGIILIGYYLLLFIPTHEAIEYGIYTKDGCLVGYIDRILLPGKLHEGTFDPEGLLSAIPAVATALLGMFAGEIVKSEKSGNKKALTLFVIGIALVVAGWLWNIGFPVNKKLWTSSFVCVAGGYSYLLFALFYYLIDVKKWQSWTKFFTVIGINSITIYIAQQFINFGYTADSLFGGIYSLFNNEAIQIFLSNAGYITVCWLFLYVLYRNKIFLKV